MFCGPEYTNQKDLNSFFKGYNSFLRRCVYKRDSYEYVIEYFKKFWAAYKKENKFFTL